MNAVLLDTQAALFWWAASPRLSVLARQTIEDGESDILLSAASAWEIATKFRIGKLDFAGDPILVVPRLMAKNGFRFLTVTGAHGLRAGMLGGTHKDPFDRMIAAQALIEDLTVLTCDPAIAALGCKVLW